MRTILLILAILAAATTSVQASPFLISDNSTQEVDSCQITGLGTVPCTLGSGKGLRVDLGSLPPGSYTVTAKYCAQGGLWCSVASSPFVFSKPNLGAPGNIRLSQ
jgi:hypothetical protein